MHYDHWESREIPTKECNYQQYIHVALPASSVCASKTPTSQPSMFTTKKIYHCLINSDPATQASYCLWKFRISTLQEGELQVNLKWQLNAKKKFYWASCNSLSRLEVTYSLHTHSLWWEYLAELLCWSTHWQFWYSHSELPHTGQCTHSTGNNITD